MKAFNTLTLMAATMLLAGSFPGAAEAGYGSCQKGSSWQPRSGYCPPPSYDYSPPPSSGYCPPPSATPDAGCQPDQGVGEGGSEFDDGFCDDEGIEEQSDLGALEGLWEAVSTDGNGRQQRIRMDVRADATAQLTVPTGRGGYQTLTGSVSVSSGQLLLDCRGRRISLGQVVTANARLVVLKNRGGNVIFRRP